MAEAGSDPPTHAERIGPTAHYTAYVWRRIGLPHAEHFATWQGAMLYWGFFAMGEWATRLSPRVPTMRAYLEYRHRLIDQVVAQLRPGVVVELGAGLTRRAVTWAADRGVPGIELDLPGMARIKRQRLAEAPASLRQRLAGRHEVHEADALAPDFSDALTGWLRGYERPVVVAEGLLNYFDESARRRVLAAVAGALRIHGQGAFVAELHTADAQARVGWAMHALRTAQRGITRRRHASCAFADLPTLRRAFADAGFDDCRPVRPQDHVHHEPRLAGLHSPVHVIDARVGPMV